MKTKDKIIIVGAGLCGSMLALRLVQRGFKVALYEKRPDLRKYVLDAGRSINLALSPRGLWALERVGLKERVLEQCISMQGRLIHPLTGDAFLSPYSGRKDDYINSVSRPGLNTMLLDEADKHADINIHFDHDVRNVDLENARINGYDHTTHSDFSDEGLVVIGTDGAGSVVRRAIMAKTTDLLFNYSQKFLRHGYKELSIHPGEGGAFKIEKNALHIWPRGEFMIIALPNLDASFTLTMFHPIHGDIGFNALNNEEKLKAFFEKYYQDLLPYIPHYVEEYFENPVGTLGTIKCYPWQAYGRTLVMGDASHAIVPFYGQGMNASFEDVRVFDELMNVHGEDWKSLFEAFQDARHKNTDAIADLAIDNFYEMRDHVDDEDFKAKRELEMKMEQQFPEYYSKYSLVTFKPEWSYEKAMIVGRKQDELLLNIVRSCNGHTDPASALEKIKELHKTLEYEI